MTAMVITALITTLITAVTPASGGHRGRRRPARGSYHPAQ